MSQNNQREFFGIVISVDIMGNSELSLTDKFVYSYIASYSRCCMDSNARIAERLGVGLRSVIRSIGHLQERGMLEAKFGARSARKLYICAADSTCGKLVEKSVKKTVEKSEGCVKMAQWCAKMATLKTDKGVPKWLPKNKRINKKNNSSRGEFLLNNTPAGLAGLRPASRRKRVGKVVRMGELIT